MTRGPSGSWIDNEQTMHLVDPSTPTALEGDLIWTQTETTTVRGVVAVDAPKGDWEELRVELHVTPMRPERFFASFVCRAGWIRRLCVNKQHRPIDGTHKHRIVAGAEDCYEPDDIPPVLVQPDVPPGTYEAVFRAFVAECTIVVPSTFHWASPWEGA
ncbi:hypothetical protein [Brachybacterium sp. GCM10030252]|uniref:hypothetical protein n=1 Tax=Brachybacterium sp. GCM10030252 TaxID=3273380 RepID=UPI003607BC24